LPGVEVPFLPSLLIGGVLASLAALIVGVPVLRLRGHYLAVATLGVLIIVQVLITNFESVTRGPLGLNGLPALTDLWWVFPLGGGHDLCELENQVFLLRSNHAGGAGGRHGRGMLRREPVSNPCGRAGYRRLSLRAWPEGFGPTW
jgi:hypothetical protein